MDANRWQRIRALLEAAQELPADERVAFLTQECGNDEELRREVESLLAAGQNAGSFIGSVADTVDSKTEPPEVGSVSMPAEIGRYRILRKLGAGGMGVVYEAQQQSPHRRVALKVVRGGRFVDESRVRLFQREAETLARLKHPNIAAIYESGRTDDGQHFFAMELVSGQTLDAYLKTRGKRVTPEELRLRLDLFRKLADAVHYAHQRGVIHRDLKPSNIIVTASDPPQPKILDFGLARITEEDLAVATLTSEVGLIKGTLPYMSPEQTRADPQEIDVRADVYSLGVILYEMLSNRQPYDVMKKALGEALRVICEETPRPLSRSWSGVRRLDADIETIVGKALQKEAERRYASAAAFSEDVGRYLDSQPILARPPSAAYHMRKFAQRNRALVGGILATSVALVAGVVVSTMFGLREAEQRREADKAREHLETVVEFQESMLSDVDAQEMGRGMMEDLRRRLADARDNQGDSAETVEQVLSQFDDWMAGVNATDAAVRILDSNVLDRASKAIAEEFGDQPQVAARLEITIAETYFNLGMTDRSEAHVRSALKRQQELLGREHLDTVQTISGLGTVLAAGHGRFEEAEPLVREVFETRERILGREHPDTLDAMSNLASLFLQQGRYNEGEPLMREVFETRERVLGGEHPDTLSAMTNVATILQEEDRYDEAELLYREAFEIQQRTLGKEHQNTLLSMINLGFLYLQRDQYDRASPLLHEALQIRRRVLGDEHPYTLSAGRILAVLYERQRRLDDAESLYRKALEGRRRVLGDDHPDTLTSEEDLRRIAIAYSQLGLFDRSESLVRPVLERRRERLGSQHPATIASIADLGAVLAEQGRYDETEPLMREVLEMRERVQGREHPYTLDALSNLGAIFMRQGRYDKGEPLMREVFETRQRVLGDEHPHTLDAGSNLAVLYEGQRRLDDAESLCRKVLESRKRVLGDDHPGTLASEENLRRILKAQKPFVPTDQYEKRSIEGWTVYVNKGLLADGTELGVEALRFLKSKLDEVVQVVPESACEELRRVPIWLGIDNGNGPTYHPSRNWLKEHGYNPDKAQSVEIGNASQFLSLPVDHSGIVLRLLADAYYDRVLGYDHEGIHEAFRAAVEGGHSERDERTYFGDGTMAFFSTDDDERDELRREDLKLFELLEEVW